MIRHQQPRRAAILPIVTVCLVGLMGLVALSIDIGMMVVARSQCQNAADIAALAGARTLDGKTASNNVSAATTMAIQAAQNNTILTTAITPAQVTTVQAGIYRYDTTAQHFRAVFGQTPGANEAYGVMQVTISTQQPTVFAKVLGIQSVNVAASATAAHRPRDVAVVLDYSGSMAYSSQFNYPGWGPITGSLNADPNFPRFGPWSIFGGAGMVLDPNSPGATPSDLFGYVPPTPMQRAFPFVDWDGQVYATNNLTIDTRNGSAIVNNFLLNDNATNAFTSSNATFPTFTNVNVSTSGNPTTIVTPAPATFSNQNASGFVGDKFPLRAGVTVSGTTAPSPDQYAHTVQEYLTGSNAGVTNTTRNSVFEQNGYDWDFSTNAMKAAAQKFQGFTMGPGYYGKTFYMWPPDPRAPVGNIGDSGYVAGDWRQRFFQALSGSGQDMRDNTIFWDANGHWNAQNPGTAASYIVNYTAVLGWLKRGPQTLPASLRAGRVDYYDAIPDTIPIDFSTGIILPSATQEQCFWKDYIDYVLGAGRYTHDTVLKGANSSNTNGNLNYNNPSNSALAVRITSRATLTGAGPTPPYMRYDDNPVHPRMQFWFGPESMLGFLQLRVYMPGTCYEAPSWQLKVGVRAALDDIKNNHPNDLSALIFFSASEGYNTARVRMGKSFTQMQNALFYPFPLINSLGTSSATVRPYLTTSPNTANPSGINDNTDTIVPNSGTETCPQMGFMVAYNELGSASAGSTTYTGRRGAAKVVIFETDGVPNYTCSGTLTASGSGGPGKSYYASVGSPAWVGTSSSLHTTPKDYARAVVKQIVAQETAAQPGYSTTRQPARVHAIAFGELFESSTSSSMKLAALRFLAAVQIDGNTSPTPSGSWDTDSLDYLTYYVNAEPYKIITGNAQQRIANLSQAFQRIMQGGVQVALIQ